MLRIVNKKTAKVILNRSDVENLIEDIILYFEDNGDCWEEVLAQDGSDKAINLIRSIKRLAKAVELEVSSAKDFDY